ncbi:putative mitochondrial inner membrane translocase TIM44 [Cardiosporidium cionae]|uniref:Mitochondrial inner membrane translocase TIM44 n=1 Tax=Cardiosporidium cionae TaxID=476202 RepID=A0ABQ7JA17_9APIC|nr:putative mitochondrial inner membrane translocase TIM44 [Cardiosporidium cionae]|eukprot:KAF8820837.1 putative mitochondrial inner membrane translocase TIM44 [Cardiosporidium cionae]
MHRVRTSAVVLSPWSLSRWMTRPPIHLRYLLKQETQWRQRREIASLLSNPLIDCLKAGEISSFAHPTDSKQPFCLTCGNRGSSYNVLNSRFAMAFARNPLSMLQEKRTFFISSSCGVSSNLVVPQRRHSSSGFIRSVMEQVKKDLDNQPELRKAMQDLRLSASEHRSFRIRFKGKLEERLASLHSFFTIIKTHSTHFSGQLSLAISAIRQKIPLSDSHTEWILTIYHKMMAISTFLMEKFHLVVEKFKDEKAGEQRTAEWRRSQAIKRYHSKQAGKQEDTVNASSGNQAETTEEADLPVDTALVLAKESAWDRFGTKLKDMPFLQNFFENPFLGKLFGETEIAASIREMKLEDSSFRLPEFMEIVEEVVAPHLIDCFLQGDTDSLRLHCGEAAFSAASSSIKERELMKVQLDPTVLQLRGVELKGARRVEDGTPWFIFTFTAQQINCLRDSHGIVVSGAIDDIREVVYSMALTKHPEPDTFGLHYPWMVKELAIIGNTACW